MITRARLLLTIVVGTAVVLAVLAALWGRDWLAGPQTAARLRPDDTAITQRGAQVYRTHCASCHGADLQGQPDWRERRPDGLLPAPPHDASGHTWHHSDEVLFRLTKHGIAAMINDPGYRSAMPAYDGVLSDADIVAVLSWIKSQWPGDVRRRHDQINERASQAR